jgi:hypothetical protein
VTRLRESELRPSTEVFPNHTAVSCGKDCACEQQIGTPLYQRIESQPVGLIVQENLYKPSQASVPMDGTEATFCSLNGPVTK